MYNPFSLQEKTILVTGASSGIGRAIAIECSRMGAKLIITGRNSTRLNQTFESLEGEGHKQCVADLTDTKQIEELVSNLPVLQGIVHAAGMLLQFPVRVIEKEDLIEVFDTNFFAVVLLNKQLICEKKIDKGTSFVFISSIAATVVGDIGNTIYAASKGALNASVRVLGQELKEWEVRVNIISPGMIETPLIYGTVPSDLLEKDRTNYPLGYGQPEDVAYCAVYLLSNAARWVTGSEFVLDGGRLL